jgi:hypothetical protein
MNLSPNYPHWNLNYPPLNFRLPSSNFSVADLNKKTPAFEWNLFSVQKKVNINEFNTDAVLHQLQYSLNVLLSLSNKYGDSTNNARLIMPKKAILFCGE